MNTASVALDNALKPLPLRARIYISSIALLAVGLALDALVTLLAEPGLLLVVAILAVVFAVLDFFPIQPFGTSIEITISDVAKFATIFLFPTHVIILSTFIGTILGEVPSKRAWSRKMFNVGMLTVTWAVVGWFYYLIHPPSTTFLSTWQDIVAVGLAGIVAFLVNTTLIMIVISFATQLPFGYVWKRNFALNILAELSAIPLGVFLAVLWTYNPPSVLLGILPLFIVRHSYQVANTLQKQTSEALVAMMRVIDERDQHTADHSERVSHYARLIAEKLDLPPDEVEVIAPAALLHDLGKVGMSDDILFGTQRLNSKERKSAEHHANIGADLLAKFPLFEKGANLVRHHHEHWDGKGYPDGLKGEEIPLGARIIAVADAFEAMTENRPYRRALTQTEAIAELRKYSGTQFDPHIVEVFIQVLEANPKLTTDPAPSPIL